MILFYVCRSKFPFRSAGVLAITPFLTPAAAYYEYVPYTWVFPFLHYLIDFFFDSYDRYYYLKAGGACAESIHQLVTQLTALLGSNATALAQLRIQWGCTAAGQDDVQMLYVTGQLIV